MNYTKYGLVPDQLREERGIDSLTFTTGTTLPRFWIVVRVVLRLPV
jgi:hypothetical protein